jgi:hypothetical protein
VASIYIFEVLCFIKKYHMNIKHNYHEHKYDTRGNHDLHMRLYHIFISKQCFKCKHKMSLEKNEKLHTIILKKS